MFCYLLGDSVCGSVEVGVSMHACAWECECVGIGVCCRSEFVGLVSMWECVCGIGVCV